MTRYASKTTGLKTFSRSWEVQRTPYKTPLPFSYNGRDENQYPAYGADQGVQTNDYAFVFAGFSSQDNQQFVQLSNSTRDAFVQKMKGGQNAALALSIMDWRKSLSMMTNAFNLLRTDMERIWRRRLRRNYTSKKVSDLYLEYIFGWVPLFSDIFQAAMVLSRPWPSTKVRVKRTTMGSAKLSTSNYNLDRICDQGMQIGGLGVMVNPNLALVESLGLINPASVAWDKVPFSFVVNWIVPVGGFLNSLTDLVGWEIHDGFTSNYYRVKVSGPILVKTGPWSTSYGWRERRITLVNVSRSRGIPSPIFPTVQLPSASLTKALISFSLLDQFIRRV